MRIVLTAAVAALFADGTSTLRNIGSWRVKETDRIAAMATELRKLGAEVDEGADWLRVPPPGAWREASIDTYDDHRIAMCFSLAAVAGLPVHIRDPKCVAKTFPDFFDRLAALTAAASPPARDQACPVPVIAIDGPTASGKGTIAERVARALGFSYLDSGALYRLVAWRALQRHVDPAD